MQYSLLTLQDFPRQTNQDAPSNDAEWKQLSDDLCFMFELFKCIESYREIRLSLYYDETEQAYRAKKIRVRRKNNAGELICPVLFPAMPEIDEGSDCLTAVLTRCGIRARFHDCYNLRRVPGNDKRAVTESLTALMNVAWKCMHERPATSSVRELWNSNSDILYEALYSERMIEMLEIALDGASTDVFDHDGWVGNFASLTLFRNENPARRMMGWIWYHPMPGFLQL